MIIILEGCDKVGKTTYANALKKSGFEVVKFSAPRDGEDLFNSYMSFLETVKSNKNYVLDRFFIGEMVYGPIYRGKSQFTIKQYNEIENKILSMPHLFIHFTNTIPFVINKFREDDEVFAKIKDIPDILRAYKKYYNSSRLLKATYTIGKNSF